MSAALLPRGKPNPWETQGRKQIYRNPWLLLEEHQVRTPAGAAGIYGVVRPHQVAIGIVPLTANDEVVLVGQYRYPLERYSWEIPEGGGRKTEDPLTEARRELAEETGFTAKRWRLLLALSLSNCLSDEQAVLFVAEDLEPGAASPDPEEELEVIQVPFETAIDAVFAGEITDAMSVAGLLAVHTQRRR